MFKAFYENQSDIPKGHESFYAEKDGKWVLQVEGMVPASAVQEVKAKLDEFRSNNITLSTQLKEFEGKKFLTQDELEEFERLSKEHNDNKDKKLIDAGKIDELLASRTERMRNDYEAKLAALNESLEKTAGVAKTHEGRLATVLVENEVGKVLSKSGLVPVQGALSDLTSRASSVWKVNEKGDLVAMDANGQQLYGSEAQPLTMSEWAASTAKDAPYLFADNKGTGGQGGKGGAARMNDGIIQIPSNDEHMKSMHIEDIASGKAVVVDAN